MKQKSKIKQKKKKQKITAQRENKEDDRLGSKLY